MTKADVVIGAAYGDEGKGLMTDYLSSQYDESIVVRFNGGGQAGHTVQTPEGGIHVFSSFGSGSYNNSHTYLSQFFILNPVLFFKEAEVLGRNGIPRFPNVTVHPDARMTTPYDMLVNQLLAKNNSCGAGINETVIRHQAGFKLSARAIHAPIWSLEQELTEYRDVYLKARMEQLGLTLTDEQAAVIFSDNMLKNFIFEVKSMGDYVTVGKMKPTKTPIIFEGAQGLLLDDDYDKEFGTPSKTGMHNVKILASMLEIDELHVNYMVRAYLTRHGAGNFPSEDENLKYYDITNRNGIYQGPLRFGRFDLPLIRDVINADRYGNNNRIVVTHLDQMAPYMEFINEDGKLDAMSRIEFAEHLAQSLNMDSYAESWGATRKDVKCHTLSKLPVRQPV